MPAINAARNAAQTTTSHCTRFTAGDCICVNGAANAGTPAVNDGISVENQYRNRLVERIDDVSENVLLSHGGEAGEVDVAVADMRWLHLYCARPRKWLTPPNVGENVGADPCGLGGSRPKAADDGNPFAFVRTDTMSAPLILS